MPAEKERNNQITSRLQPELRARVDAINRRHLTSDATILVELLTAFCQSVEEVDAVRFPVVVLMAEPVAKAAEEGSAYPAPAPGATTKIDHAAHAAAAESAADEERRRRAKRRRTKPSPG